MRMLKSKAQQTLHIGFSQLSLPICRNYSSSFLQIVAAGTQYFYSTIQLTYGRNLEQKRKREKKTTTEER